MNVLRLVPDTSIIIDGRLVGLLQERKNKGEDLEVFIPNAVVAELEAQANRGREIGFDGLAELSRLQEAKRELGIRVSFVGETPKSSDIQNATIGVLDSLIRKVAEENDAILLTSDGIQAQVAKAKGVRIEYLPPKERLKKPEVLGLFDAKTMSLHLKENTPVYAKKGHVGAFELVKAADKVSREKLETYVREIVEAAHSDPDGLIELEKEGATVIQLREYRIVIARPPFSDGLELTIVRPLVKTKLSDYNLSQKLIDRLDNRTEGVFVAGSPGAGKTTFVQALAEHYRQKNKIIKTMEHPRDLMVHDDITQYGPLEGSMEATGDLLLLMRPDYTVYDELRKTSDFKVFADMRLAGVGLVGVCHASKAIDAIQRLVGRVELGVIPHVIDTVIYIKAGKVEKVYALEMTVKVPYGMTESDLSRPVIQIKDFESERQEYELYSYGEEVVVIPVKGGGGGRERSRPDFASTGVRVTKKHVVINARNMRNQSVAVFAGDVFIAKIRVNRGGSIKITKNSAEGRMLIEALDSGSEIRLER